jgi:hypothetical protein
MDSCFSGSDTAYPLGSYQIYVGTCGKFFQIFLIRNPQYEDPLLHTHKHKPLQTLLCGLLVI